MQCYNCNSERLKYNKEKDAYICLDCGHEFLKQYFFISHSHMDIEKVRIIRNIIEETFFYEPILFFLKCLSEDEEIRDLIQREIDERIWFVYCKSENAEKSKYVLEERKYIDNLIAKGKVKNRLQIELDEFDIWDEKCYDYIRNQIACQIRKTKVFLSYSSRDKDIAEIMHNWFTRRGYSVWWKPDFDKNISVKDSIQQGIREHSYRDGIIVPIMTKNSLNDAQVMIEIGYAMGQGAMILPIVVKERGETLTLPFSLSDLCCAVAEKDNIESSLEYFLNVITKK